MRTKVRTGFVHVLGLVVALAAATGARGQAPAEDKVKAAFIYNFTQFVAWTGPAAASNGPIVVGVLGSDAMRPALEEVLRAKEQKSRRYEVRVFASVEEVRGCRVLFVDLPGPRADRALEVLPRAGILTIGEGEAFARNGGVIAILKEGNRVKFDINLSAAERAGLKVDPTLLGLARQAGHW